VVPILDGTLQVIGKTPGGTLKGRVPANGFNSADMSVIMETACSVLQNLFADRVFRIPHWSARAGSATAEPPGTISLPCGGRRKGWTGECC
jgi:hypothetical protein